MNALEVIDLRLDQTEVDVHKVHRTAEIERSKQNGIILNTCRGREGRVKVAEQIGPLLRQLEEGRLSFALMAIQANWCLRNLGIALLTQRFQGEGQDVL